MIWMPFSKNSFRTVSAASKSLAFLASARVEMAFSTSSSVSPALSEDMKQLLKGLLPVYDCLINSQAQLQDMLRAAQLLLVPARCHKSSLHMTPPASLNTK